MNYLDQDDLDRVREWSKTNRELRKFEAERLEFELEEVEAALDKFEEKLERHRETESKLGWNRRELVPNPNEVEIERYHQLLKGKRKDILHQIRDLIRWDREDLQWIWTLERQQREMSKSYRSLVEESTKRPGRQRQQQRAANWKANQATNREKPETSKD